MRDTKMELRNYQVWWFISHFGVDLQTREDEAYFRIVNIYYLQKETNEGKETQYDSICDEFY